MKKEINKELKSVNDAVVEEVMKLYQNGTINSAEGVQ